MLTEPVYWIRFQSTRGTKLQKRKASTMFAVETPWNAHGTTFHDDVSVSEAIEKSTANFEVVEDKLMGGDTGAEIEGYKALLKSGSNELLGVVKAGYEVIQPREVFDWFQPAIDEGLATIEASGSIQNGKRLFVMCKLGTDAIEIVPGDPVKAYCLLGHSYDGSLAVQLGFSDYRWVCANMLKADTGFLKFKHTKNVRLKLETARDLFGQHQNELQETADQYRYLTKVNCNETKLAEYVRRVIKGHEYADDEKARVRGFDIIRDNFENGRGSEYSRGTMWGAFNAITEHISHSQGRTADGRLNSQFFGQGAKLAQRAFNVAMTMAD